MLATGGEIDSCSPPSGLRLRPAGSSQLKPNDGTISMGERQYVYLIHEVPVEFPYYCKVGFSSRPLERLADLQAGNPRPLRSIEYSTRPTTDFGLPLPSESHARALEKRLFERFSVEGLTFYGDVNYESLQPSRREWVSGIHPERLRDIVLAEWVDYLSANRLDAVVLP
jgi:hypothetical protein